MLAAVISINTMHRMLISSASYEALGLMAGWSDCRPCGRLVRRLNSN
jgi:hypothetical protein